MANSRLPPDLGKGRPINEIGRPLPSTVKFADEGAQVDQMTGAYAEKDAVVITSLASAPAKVSLEEGLQRARALVQMAAGGLRGARRRRRVEMAQQMQAACLLAAQARGWSPQQIKSHPVFREIGQWLQGSTRMENK